jgi:hypothetical protein
MPWLVCPLRRSSKRIGIAYAVFMTPGCRRGCGVMGRAGNSTRCDLVIFRYANGEPHESVTPVTAVGDGLCSPAGDGEAVMMSNQMYDNLSSALPIDDRNERPLLVALIAIIAAWSILFLLGL